MIRCDLRGLPYRDLTKIVGDVLIQKRVLVHQTNEKKFFQQLNITRKIVRSEL